jgi:hypothetical protein
MYGTCVIGHTTDNIMQRIIHEDTDDDPRHDASALACSAEGLNFRCTDETTSIRNTSISYSERLDPTLIG